MILAPTPVGRGPLQRAPAGAKVLGLLVVTVVAFAVGSVPVLGGLLVVVAVGWTVTAPPWPVLGRFLRFLLGAAAILVAVQWWFLGAATATVVGLRFVTTVGAAQLLTMTTGVAALVELVERLARPVLGARAERVGLLVGLTVAAIAALSRIAAEVGDAARARGAERSPTARLVPLVVRAVRHADELGEALAARGLGDE